MTGPIASGVDLRMDRQEQIEHLGRKIRGLVREIIELATSPVPPEEFFRQFLTRVLQAMEGVGGAVWYVSGPGQLRLGAAANLDRIPFADFVRPEAAGSPAAGAPPPPDAESSGSDQPDLQRFVSRVVLAVLKERKPAVLGPAEGDSLSAESPPRPPGDRAWETPPLLVTPIVTDDQAAGALLVAPQPGTDPRALRGMVSFMGEVCRQAAIYIQQQRLRALARIQEYTQQALTLLEQAHASLDPVRVAFVLANLGQTIVGCDRLSVVLAHGLHKGRVLAVSGHDTVQRRSVLMKRLADLGRQVAAAGTVLRDPAPGPIGHSDTENTEAIPTPGPLGTGTPQHLSARLEAALARYRVATQMQSVVVAPMGHEGRPVGALIAEGKGAQALTEAHVARLGQVARHGAPALANALRYHRLPLLRAMGVVKGLLGRLFGRTLPRIALRLALIAAPILALIFVPWELTVRGKVTANPEDTRMAYVQVDGVVGEVLVKEGATVQASQVLARLHQGRLRAQLAYEKAQLGAAQATLKDLEASTRPQDRGQAHIQRFVVEERQARVALAEEQLAMTEVLAPIAGTVLDPRPEELLERPVQRGEALFRIAPLTEKWTLEINLPEAEVGHVLAARESAEEPLTVSFYLSAYPQRRFTTKVRQIAPQAALHEERNVVRITADLPPEVPDLKPQMRGEARIHCGRRALGYVLFRGVVDFVRTHLTF